MAQINIDNLNTYLNPDEKKAEENVKNLVNIDSLSTNIGTNPSYSFLAADKILDYGEDISNRDYLDDSYSFLTGYDTHELRANRQPWISKAGAGVGRVGTKVLSEIAKMPGVIGGVLAGTAGQIEDLISGEDNTDFIQTAFNNPWINAVNELEQTVKDKGLPVYVEKAVSEGNLWDNITSIDFWATEGADGLGYIISMLAPGAAINRLNLGAKLFKGTSSIFKMLDKTEEAAKVLSKYGITPNNLNLHSATIANTLFEAGAEAHSAMESYKASLDMRRNLSVTDPDYLSEDEYEKALEKQSNVGRNVFLSNVGILIGPNAIMSKMLWGKNFNKGTSIKYSKNGYEKLKKLTGKDLIARGAEKFAIGTVREGFFEEGLQSTAEHFFTERPDSGLGDFIYSLSEEYANMVSTTDGQKAIFLGSVFGGGMSAYQGTVNENKKADNANNLINNVNQILKDLDNFFDTDVKFVEEGLKEIKGDKELKDPAKVKARLKGLKQLEELNEVYNKAVKEKDQETIDGVREIMTTMLIKPFILNDTLGIDALRQYLEANEKLLGLSKEEKPSKNKYIKDILAKASSMKDNFESYTQFADIFMDLKNENATKEDIVNFKRQKALEYVNSKTYERYTAKQLEVLDEQIKSIEKDYESELTSKNESENEEALNKIENDPRFVAIKDYKNSFEELNKKTKEVSKKFWDNKNISKQFDGYVKDARKTEEIIAQAKEITDLLDEIKKAKNLKKLDKIKIPDTEVAKQAKSEIEKAIADRRQELIDAKKTKDEKEKEEAKRKKDEQEREAAERAESVEKIKNQMAVGEKISIDPTFKAKMSENLQSDFYTFKGVDKNNSILLETKEGRVFPMNPKRFLETARVYSEEDLSSTEGGIELGSNESHLNSMTTGNVNYDARVVTTNNQSGAKNKALPFIEAVVIAYERNTEDKRKSYKVKIVEVESEDNPQWMEATALVLEKGWNGLSSEEIDFVIDNIPMSIQLTPDISAPLETKTKGDQTVFNNTSRLLRKAIIQEILNGTSINDITVDITGQYNGELMLDGQAVNNIADLFEFKGDISNIKIADIFYVDHNQSLRNMPGRQKYETMSTTVPSSPGNIFIKIKTAAGRDFPLKLNVAKISEKEADLLYDLVKFRMDSRVESIAKKEEDGSNEITLANLPDILEKFKNEFPNEVELFQKEGINLEDITVKQLLRFFAYDSNSPSNKFRFSNETFIVGEEVFTPENMDRDSFIAQTTAIKRRHIKLKRTKNDVDNLNISRRNYLEYLIKNKVLNTNAVVKEPTFQGKTTMYIDTASVKVKGELSSFNESYFDTYNDNLLGTNSQLAVLLPGLFKRTIDPEPVVKDGVSYYKDDKGNLIPRVSTLKGRVPRVSNLNYAAQRGLLVDELIREFFMRHMNEAEFVEFGNEMLENLNKRFPKQEILVSEDSLLELFDIFAEYKDIFNKNNYTIFPVTNPLYGNLKKFGDIAGSMDLLAYDNNNDKWIIIDLKTSSEDRADIYNQKKPSIPYKSQDSIQQNAYRELFKQRTGIDAEMLILPLTWQSEDNKGDYTGYPERTNAKKKFLEVKKEDIYKIGNFPKRTKRKPSNKNKSKIRIIPTPDSKSTTKEFKEFAKSYMRGDYFSVNYKGTNFFITKPIIENGEVVSGFYFGLMPSENEPFKQIEVPDNAEDIIRILIKNYGKKIPKEFTKENAIKVWNSRKNSVPLSETKKSKPKTKSNTKKTTKDNKSKIEKVLEEIAEVKKQKKKALDEIPSEQEAIDFIVAARERRKGETGLHPGRTTRITSIEAMYNNPEGWVLPEDQEKTKFYAKHLLNYKRAGKEVRTTFGGSYIGRTSQELVAESYDKTLAELNKKLEVLKQESGKPEPKQPKKRFLGQYDSFNPLEVEKENVEEFVRRLLDYVQNNTSSTEYLQFTDDTNFLLSNLDDVTPQQEVKIAYDVAAKILKSKEDLDTHCKESISNIRVPF